MRIISKLFVTIIYLSISWTYAQQQDKYPNKVTIGIQQGYGFTVEYFDTYKVVQNLITNEKYALVCCNQSLANFTSAASTSYTAIVNTPLNNVGIDNELDALPFFELLGLIDKVKSAKLSANITSPCFAGISDSPNATVTTNPIDAIFTTTSITMGDINTKPQYISFSAKNDTLTPLQQSAWILYIAHFFDLEQHGQDVYNSIMEKYSCHKSNLAESGKKNIAWTTFDSVNKAWTTHYEPYVQQLIADAGMQLVSEKNQTSVYTDLTLFHSALQHVEYIIDDTPAANFNKSDLTYAEWLTTAGLNPNTNAYPFLVGLNLFRTDRFISTSGFSDWPIRHAARADLAIADVIHMVYNTYEPTYNMTWLRAFAQMEDSKFIKNTNYPTCSMNTTAVAERLNLNSCHINPFKPNTTISASPKHSNNHSLNHNLSVGAKVGIAIGVIVGVAALAVIGTFAYRKIKYTAAKNKEGAFYRMSDM
ncbi:hypothetical protein BDF20DRAFT_914748 [Mycotypha africana]|uniref:uncharacterized protein n=1 Tax=Mycotypha africana TaxID=64632 RepID=UPI002300AF74|nr:uncharacterized protein BDF20DRAFT_914748 [Mycotypha africana]KAI8973278.1 hypothetical protein BDF20DRAFT_914748 [Mycotypha africana]